MKATLIGLALLGLGLCHAGCKTTGKRGGEPARALASYKKGEPISAPWTAADMQASLKPGTRFVYTTNAKLKTAIEVVSTGAETHTIQRALNSAKPVEKVYPWSDYLGYLKRDLGQDPLKSCEVIEESYRFGGKSLAALRYEIKSTLTVGAKSAPLTVDLWFAKDQPGLLLRRRAKTSGVTRSDMKLDETSLLPGS